MEINTAAPVITRDETAGLDITSTVAEIDPPHRIVWGGPAQGIVGPSTSGRLNARTMARGWRT
jgi:hypothetical protein